jgi:uncharacterized protein (TIGR02444 family)
MSRGGEGPVSRSAAGATDATALAAELWTFALAFYAREGAAQACLALQERIGADVDIVLFGLFALLRKGVSLEAEDVRAVDALADGWRAEIVRPLRQLRTRLKSGPIPAPSASTGKLRDRIKSIEIEAERIELDMLAGWLTEHEARRNSTNDDPHDLLELIAKHFARAAGRPNDDPQVEGALRALAHAASTFAGEASGSTGPHS